MHLQVDKSTGKDDAGLEKGGVPRQNTAPERSQSETDRFFRCPHCMFPLDGVPDPSGHLHKCSQHLDFVARGYFQTRKKCEQEKTAAQGLTPTTWIIFTKSFSFESLMYNK